MRISNFSKCAVAAVTLIAAPFSLRAASGFEGKIDMTITVPQKPKDSMTLHYTIKDKKLRFDMPTPAGRGNGSVAMVVNYDTREMITLIDSGSSNGEEHKMAMRRTLPTPQEAAALAGSHSGSGGEATPAPVATGKTATILGYTATEYMMTTKKGEEVDMWMAKGLGNFMSSAGGQGGFGGRHAQVSPEWEAFAQNAGFFPLRVVTHDKGGKETMRMEVTKIDKSSVPDSAFSTEGYQEMQLPSFGQMFGH